MRELHYVYEHWRPDLDVCFYVGKGKGRRSRIMYGRNAHHTRIQNKLARLGMVVEIRMVAFGLSEAEALALEQERISFWIASGLELANKTSGGEGQTPNEEVRQKMSLAKRGRKLKASHKQKISDSLKLAFKDPLVREKLVKHSQTPKSRARAKNLHKYVPRTKEHYEKVSAALMGKKLSPERIEKTRLKNLGRKQSAETIELRRQALIGKKRNDEFRAKMQALWTPERKAAHAEKMRQNKELLEKMRQSNIGNKHTLGKKHSEETKIKMRAAHSKRRCYTEGDK